MAGTSDPMTESNRGEISNAIHEAAEDWLLALQSGRNPELAEAHARWLAESAEHRRAYAFVLATWRDGALLRSSDEGQSRALVKAPWLMRHSTHRAGAVLAVGAFGALVVTSLHLYGPPLPVSQAAAETLRTKVGEIRPVSLRGGTRLVLDTATTVTVEQAPNERRVVVVAGRIRLAQSPGDRARYLVVVRGVTFTPRSGIVDVSATEPAPSVHLLRGAVDFIVAPGERQPADPPLAPGERVVLGPVLPAHPVPARDSGWINGMLQADGLPLAAAIDQINRYNRIQIELAEPSPATALLITGAFRVRDPDGFARAVAAMFAMTLDRTGDRLILSSTRRQPARK
ncbi:FecR family protein [Sphingomonas sp. 1P08PE]|uniref:FecR family protein n=1 Tax=Sphingomonas sp. 1P08PE TaxID=554122 RepID=UPI0039A2BFA9